MELTAQLTASLLCFCLPHQAEDGVSMLAVAGGDGVRVRPRVWIGVQGQLRLQQPEQQGKDTGGSSSTSSQLCCRRLFYFFPVTAVSTKGCSSQGHSNTNKTKTERKTEKKWQKNKFELQN